MTPSARSSCPFRPALALAAIVWAAAPTEGAAGTCGGFRGDCNGDGRVSIGELQRAVNMSLAIEAPACGADADAGGTVTGEELAAVVDSFLGEASAPAVHVYPESALLATGSTVLFSGAVAGCGDGAGVTWSVQEGAAGGTVAADGLYTAPATAGTYHVVATAAADAALTAMSIVAVTDTATLAEETLTPSAADQTVSVPGRIAATIAGGSLTEPTKVTIVEVTGVPAPPAPARLPPRRRAPARSSARSS